MASAAYNPPPRSVYAARPAAELPALGETWVKVGPDTVTLHVEGKTSVTRLAPAVDWATGEEVRARPAASPWGGVPKKAKGPVILEKITGP